jgi:SAM-dependent methyltransferase
VATLTHPRGTIAVEELGDGLRRIEARLDDPSGFVARPECRTTYPLPLIERLLDLKGPEWLCDEIARDEDPTYVAADLRFGIFAFVSDEQMRGRRMLDFGCGAGASTMILARCLPDTSIVAIDLDERLLEIARLRAAHHRAANVRFLWSPDAAGLPEGLGTFDYIILSAVWEHLMPSERRGLVPQLWSLLAPGGVLFINQTPHRHYPIEGHTTGLPFLNYLPDRLALAAARRLSSRVEDDVSWDRLLRDGVRGATEQEVLAVLRATGIDRPMSLAPWRLGIRDLADLQGAIVAERGGRRPVVQKAIKGVHKAVGRILGTGFAPNLTMAVVRCPVPEPRPTEAGSADG